MLTLYCCIIVPPTASSFCTTTFSSTKHPPCNEYIVLYKISTILIKILLFSLLSKFEKKSKRTL